MLITTADQRHYRFSPSGRYVEESGLVVMMRRNGPPKEPADSRLSGLEPPKDPGGRSHLTRRRVATIFAWALITVMAAAGCSDDGDLAVLRGEPMAHAEFDGLRLVQETERSAVEEGVTGKPTYARITRIFEPTGAVTAEQGAQDIADTAKAEGFTSVSQTSQGFLPHQNS